MTISIFQFEVLVKDYLTVFMIAAAGVTALLYNDQEASVTNFLQQKKIMRLFQEQNNIFDDLPDGLILFSNSC